MDGRQVDCGALIPFKQLSFLLNPQFTLVFFDTMVKICRFRVTIIDIFSSSLLPKPLSSSSQCSQLIVITMIERLLCTCCFHTGCVHFQPASYMAHSADRLLSFSEKWQQ